MELSVRENLGFKDAFFVNDLEHQLQIVRVIRKFKPEIILTNAEYDRHPDHTRASKLIEEAFFKAGLLKLETLDENGDKQEAWRPKKLYHFIQSISREPDFLVDISDAMQLKMDAINCYKSQFFDPDSREAETYISSPSFMNMIKSRASELGHRIQVDYAEGFTQNQFLGIKDIFHLV